MNDFLIDLISLSLGGAIVIVLLAVVAYCSRSRYAARWRCWVWLALCLRLLIPVSLIPEKQAPPIQIPIPNNVVIHAPEEHPLPPDVPEENSADRPAAGAPLIDEKPKVLTLFQIAGVVWGLGASAVAGWAILSHLRFLAYLRRWGKAVTEPEILENFQRVDELLALRQRPALMICKGVKAPMLAGLFRPILLMPEKPMEGRELRYALLHELTHFKRHDIWLKSLCLLVQCLHWFNPAVWYMAHLIERDTELGCDEEALRCLPAAEHAAYGETILHAVERLNTAS